MDPNALEHAQHVKTQCEQEWLRRPYVMGVGIGRRRIGSNMTDEPCIVVYVDDKQFERQLERAFPPELQGVPIEIKTQRFGLRR